MTETPTVERKQCSKCHEEKAAQDFDRYKRTADGLQSQCKACMKVLHLSVECCTPLRPARPVVEVNCSPCCSRLRSVPD